MSHTLLLRPLVFLSHVSQLGTRFSHFLIPKLPISVHDWFAFFFPWDATFAILGFGFISFGFKNL